MVGCDGLRSTVRKQAGIAFEGWMHGGLFFVADVQLPSSEMND